MLDKWAVGPGSVMVLYIVVDMVTDWNQSNYFSNVGVECYSIRCSLADWNAGFAAKDIEAGWVEDTEAVALDSYCSIVATNKKDIN